MIKHYIAIGLYNQFTVDEGYFGYIHDDFGNLVGINEDQFDQRYYHRTGVML